MLKPKQPLILFIASVIAAGAIVHSEAPKEDVDSLFLSLIQTVGAEEPAPLKLGALDFLSSVYEEADYYQAGLCDERLTRKRPDTRVYVAGLPQEVIREFQRPVGGRITSPFGLREGGSRMHKGVDLALHMGDSICAAIGGVASRVGYEKGGYGYFIIIDHPSGIQSRYAHLQQPLVKVGDAITAGAIIALGGCSGNSTGPHLHFELRCGGLPLDPTPLLRD